MPELPEVEVVRRGLEQILLPNSVIKEIECTREDLREPFPVKEFKKLKGARIQKILRRAKYLIIETDFGNLLSHLGMTGTWRVAPKGDEQKHDHVYLHLKDGRRLAYRDPRRFGYLGYFAKGQSHIKLEELGPEPLSDEFDAAYLIKKLDGKTAALKILIMDQKVVVGVGNIYACEALFSSGIHPETSGMDLKFKDAQKLVKEIKKILTRSIEKGGSTISDFTATNGASGYFQNSFKVYNREGELCSGCRSYPIQKIVQGGRSTFFCSICQK